LSNANAFLTFAIIAARSGGAPAVITNGTAFTVALCVTLATVVGRVHAISIRVTHEPVSAFSLDAFFAGSGTNDAPSVQTHALAVAFAVHTWLARFAAVHAISTVVANTFGAFAVDAFLAQISTVHAHARICEPRQAHANAFLAFTVIAARCRHAPTVIANTIVTVVVRVALAAIVGGVHAKTVETDKTSGAFSLHAFFAGTAAFHANVI